MQVSLPTYFDYSCFFHYRDHEHRHAVVAWVACNSLESVSSVEKACSENPTDKHLQVWMRRDAAWTKAMSNELSVNGSMGKYLVERKIPNAGEKGAKRWGKIQSTISKLHSIQYVLKDGGEMFVHNVEITDDMRSPPDMVYELRDVRRRRQTTLDGVPKKGPKAFYQQLMDLWEANGKPSSHEEIYRMIVRNCVLNKWNYCDARSIYRMATYVSLRTNPSSTEERLFREYQGILSGV